ncbi:MAG TPA: sulfurtransferase [Rubrivivax sp.]
MPRILNVASYRFTPLPDAASLRDALFARADALQIKGTLLLAEEGINLSLAAPEPSLRRFMAELQTDARFTALPLKESFSDTLPFRRLRVKLKREIIRMNRPAIRPATGRASAVDPGTLARWLAAGCCDEGRPVVLLDTRNGFEIDAGMFEGALDWRLAKFSDFPAALASHQAQLAGKTVVSYCTGGIRCEKAALVMSQAGVEHVHQLDGGILKYFEDLPAAPGWRGRCFVFDERVALNPDLEPAAA